MNMLKKCMIAPILAGLLLLSCGRNSSALKDGYYNAESDEFDYEGWKEYLTICVSGGRIILAEYNAYNHSGFIKSWDMDYMRDMSAWGGTYPNLYYRHYARLLLRFQEETSEIDVLSGASRSYPVFIKLAEAVIRNACEGNSKTTLVCLRDGH